MTTEPPPLVVALLTAEASARLLLGPEGTSLSDLAARQLPGEVGVDVRPTEVGTMRELATLLERDEGLISGAQALVVGLVADLQAWERSADRPSGPDLEEDFAAALVEVVAVAKRHGVTVIALNESTYDPAGPSVSYRDTGETAAVVLHRLDAVLLRTSMEHGISIVDVDRILSADGAAGGVAPAVTYDESVAPLIRAELLRVLEDYGYFDDRPKLEQLGKAGRRAARARADETSGGDRA